MGPLKTDDYDLKAIARQFGRHSSYFLEMLFASASVNFALLLTPIL